MLLQKLFFWKICMQTIFLYRGRIQAWAYAYIVLRKTTIPFVERKIKEIFLKPRKMLPKAILFKKISSLRVAKAMIYLHIYFGGQFFIAKVSNFESFFTWNMANNNTCPTIIFFGAKHRNYQKMKTNIYIFLYRPVLCGDSRIGFQGGEGTIWKKKLSRKIYCRFRIFKYPICRQTLGS